MLKGHKLFIKTLSEIPGQPLKHSHFLLTKAAWQNKYQIAPSLRMHKGISNTLTVHLYLVTAWRGRPVSRQPEEHSAIGWFSLVEARGLRLADPGYPLLFERYLASNSRP